MNGKAAKSNPNNQPNNINTPLNNNTIIAIGIAIATNPTITGVNNTLQKDPINPIPKAPRTAVPIA